ncbi:AMP-binding protein [Micromonospora sp. NPDC048871]|uniref:AMP-binding protein n=1 Tax=unclassified Micromonospora TaxID=2617518 RepID=UPI002E12E983|nr:AMP-binding protein [Micromonospora sp. NBC_01739]
MTPIGNPPVAPTGDDSPWTHTELAAQAAARARRDGGLLVCSGGTTGTPKITALSPDLGVTRVLASWQPLGPGDVLLNLFSVGKMWGAQYFYNAFALRSRAVVAPMGALNPAEVRQWAPDLINMGVTAIAGAPNVLAHFADAVREIGLSLPVRAALWSGEPMTAARQRAIRAAFPQVGFWGNYGSIETFVIATSGPRCRLGAMHLLPDQVIEPDEGGALLTRHGEGWPTDARRFRLGDRIAATGCPCGEADAIEVLGRADDNFKLGGGMISAGVLLRNAAGLDGVEDVQLVLYRDPRVPAAVVGLRLRYTGPNPDAEGIREQLVQGYEDLEVLNRHSPEAVVVERVSAVTRHPATDKVVPVLWENAEDLAGVAS